MIEKIKNDIILQNIIKYSKDENIYLVGGCVRDFLLGKQNFDKDIIVDCSNVRDYAARLSQNLDATFIVLDDENKIYRLVLKDKVNYIDIAGIIGTCLEDDLKRRDFTINSIAVDLRTMKIVDINNGIDDLKSKIIRGIEDKNFYDDSLRLLRAFRFRATLGFKIDNHLMDIINNNYSLLDNIAIERINSELQKLFEGTYTSEALLEMGKLVEYLFPVMVDVKKVPKNSHHHLPLYYHSIETVKQIQNLYMKESEEVKNILKPRLGLLKLSAFLHDIGKPKTWTIEEDTGRHRFIKHDEVGSNIVKNTLKSLNFSKKQIDYVSEMIKNHIYPSQVISSQGDRQKTYMRCIRKLDEHVVDVVMLAKADRLSARGPEITDEIVNSNIAGLDDLKSYYLSIKDRLVPLPILLDGHEIMDIFKLKPSPELGKIVKALKEAQLNGDVNTKSEAISYVSSILTL